MKYTTTPPITDSFDFDLKGSNEVIEFRFRKAFPEATKCFAWLKGGINRGAKWESLLDSYINRVGARRAMTLTREVRDIIAIGLRRDRDIDTLVCNILGWDRELLAYQDETSREFLTKLYRALQNEHSVSKRP